jgi:hypothetical protein
LLVAGIGIGVLANYIWPRVTVPFAVEEPIEILSYTTELNFYPGETKEFNVTVFNHATVSYNVTLNFQLNVPNYQARYVTFSDEVYLVTTGQHDVEAWASVRADAPAINCSLTVEIRRAAETHGIAEDFTDGTWIEVDPNYHLSKASATHVDAYLRQDEDAYIYKDYGADHFGDFTHLIDVYLVSHGSSSCGCILWGLANSVDDQLGIQNAGGTEIFVYGYVGPSPHSLYLAECYSNSLYFSASYYSFNSGTWYYLKIVKSGTS